MKELRSPALPVLVLALLTACGGGGGGGGGDGGNDPGLFSVRTMDPTTGTSGIPNDSAVTIHLTARVDENTVGPGSYMVRRTGSPDVSSGVYSFSPDGLRVTFRPEPWYQTATSYTVEVTSELKSSTGEPLSRRFIATFTTGPWPSPRAVTQAEFHDVFDTMSTGRSRHTSTLLSDGSVLLAGGYRTGSAVTPNAEVFDPSPFREEFVAVQPMAEARANHSAVLLGNSLVLLAGGEASDASPIRSSELFSLAAGRFLPGPDMNLARTVHTATNLPDGRVLVTGGLPLDTAGSTAEIYDPSTDSWSLTANDMAEARWGHRATLFTEGPLAGQVLITGGFWSFDNPLKTVEIFDPATGRFRKAVGSLIFSRWRHSAVELSQGLVLISDGGEKTGEFFNPATGTFTVTGNGDSQDRYETAAFEFRTGEVLHLGGFMFTPSGDLFLHQTVEQYIQNYGPTGKYFSRPSKTDGGVTLSDSRAYARWTRLGDGRFFITGGLGPAFDDPDLDTAVIFDPVP